MTSSCAGEAITLLMLMSLMMKSGLYHQPGGARQRMHVRHAAGHRAVQALQLPPALHTVWSGPGLASAQAATSCPCVKGRGGARYGWSSDGENGSPGVGQVALSSWQRSSLLDGKHRGCVVGWARLPSSLATTAVTWLGSTRLSWKW